MWEIFTPGAMKGLASRLAPFVSDIDFIAIYGEIGAGKTTFVQGLLPALGIGDDVTSPTYQLVHSYDRAGKPVFHCDYYRAHPSDEETAHFTEMCGTGVVIVEWPLVLGVPLPENRLDIRIHAADEGGSRAVALTGFGGWRARLDRFQHISAFLDRHGWGDASCTAIKGDASARTFWRLERDSGTAILMDWPEKSDGPPIRDGLAYCQIAHLAREGLPFLAVGLFLRGAGLSAPEIYAADRPGGLYLVEDLGDAGFGRLIETGEEIEPLYALAVDGLAAIRASKATRSLDDGAGGIYEVPDFDRDALSIELDLLPEWYLPFAGLEAASNTQQSFHAVWQPHLDWLETQPRGLVLRDYHSPNLLQVTERSGLARLGVVDFQDALWGHQAYDLVSLLQDARLDVPENLEWLLFERYCDAERLRTDDFDAGAFARAYAILGAQRNTKILGIFARLSLRDGKHGYLTHLPRIHTYLRRNLRHPALTGLRAWYEAHLWRTSSSLEDVAVESRA